MSRMIWVEVLDESQVEEINVGEYIKKEKEMSTFKRNQIVSTILEEIENGAGAEYIVYEAVRKPYTHVAVNVDGFEGFGFSKISGTDRWDEEYGLSIARKRAVRHAVDSMEQFLTKRGENPETL